MDEQPSLTGMVQTPRSPGLRARSATILLPLFVILACQASDVLRAIPDGASPAIGTGALRAPTNVAATPTSFTTVDVTWKDVTPNESGFQVFRSGTPGPGGFVLVGSSPANFPGWNDTGLSGSTQYCYEVRAFRESGGKTSFSEFSNISCTTTPPPPSPPPPPPPSPTEAPILTWVVPVDSVTILLNWQDNSSNEDGFRFERSIDGGTTWSVAGAATASTTSLTVSDAFAERGVCYRVFAISASGDSPPSPVECATPPAAPTNFTLTVIGPGEVELSWNDNSAVEETYEIWVLYGACCYPGSGCDAQQWEYPIATLGANVTRYRTGLTSSACQPKSVAVVAIALGYVVKSEYIGVP